MKRILYMHTLDGQPAFYARLEQQLFIATRSIPIRLVRSWQYIKREQRRDAETRAKWTAPCPVRYGYQRVEVWL